MRITSVHRSPAHGFSKETVPEVRLLAGLGVEGDTHAGATVQHRSRVARDPAQPNLRQVHLLHAELLADLAAGGYDVRPGALGENLTTAGVDLLGLPTGTLLRLGTDAVVEVTGLRNPCVQIDRFSPGLLKQVLHTDAAGRPVRLTGVMAVVRQGGSVRPGDPVVVVLPEEPHVPLAPV
jgi:MOSC domain-containing protein YiiM